ncbi:hypothetical protein K227x_16370 [Rubripirellula lacrimiformis]|uniref:Lipoprotein n=1 Tax=Rubripirellula lacrimiformis TaxID=1930273 RepID=A0A517N7Y5_9BACT|nr:hypothetical protein [Rubripirellula lacrimiformis]QDT03255.1 hypothetical protein K227x_16370 [Rubripirellula lacrimiformis]
MLLRRTFTAITFAASLAVLIACSGIPLLSPNREGMAPWDKLPDGNGIAWIHQYTHDPGIDPLYLACFQYENDAALQRVVDTFTLEPLPDETDVATFTDTMPDPIDWFPLDHVTATYVFGGSSAYPGGDREYVANLWVDSTKHIAIIERTWW